MQRYRRFQLSAFAALSILTATLVFAGVVSAQLAQGSLAGTITDSLGGRVGNAVVTVRSATTATERQVAANSAGEFSIPNLEPGTYTVSVKASGFETAKSQVQIVVSTTRNVSVVLRPASIRQAVEVKGEVSSITTQGLDLTSTSLSNVITAQDLRDIPLAHRSFANIAYLSPGTEPVEPSDPTKARITAVSFGGSSGLNVELSVDGGDNSDDYIGGFLQNYSPAAIQEFAVRTAMMDADTSRTNGGSVVITTRRGTDNWHGTLAGYFRTDSLNARFPIDNPAPDPKQPFSRYNGVGAIGGPIVRNKLWIFSSFEYVDEDASIAYSPGSQSQFNALAQLASGGLIPGVSSITVPGSVPVPFKDYLGTTRLDWNQSARSQWFLRFGIDRYSTENDLVQQATLPSTGATSRSQYLNLLLSNQFTFSPTWVGSLVIEGSGLHHTEDPNSHLGFALAFPFSSTFHTISGFETFGDQQFVTPITAFPVLRNQEKYQIRYDMSHAAGDHSPRFGISFIHEPVLSGALSAAPEVLTQFLLLNPTDYAADPNQFSQDLCNPATGEPFGPNPTPGGVACTVVPPGTNGAFNQNVQRLGIYAEDSWRITPRLTVNYGLRYDTTFGLFSAEGQSQLQNPALQTLKALQIPLVGSSVPHDYRAAFAPRLGLAYALGKEANTVIRAGIGLFYNDLAQNGWVGAFQAVNTPSGVCVNPGDPGCLPGAASGGQGVLIDPHYKTPYALQATAGVEHQLNRNWQVSATWTHEQGVHQYRAYDYIAGYSLFSPLFQQDVQDQQNNVPNVDLYRTDNRSRYDGASFVIRGHVAKRLELVAHYTLASADTWGAVVGELFDYVNGVSNPLNAFGPGDYGPSGEDVRNRFVFSGIAHLPGGFEVSTLTQIESARPFTIATPVDVNNTGNPNVNRAVVNGVQTSLDEFRGTPYIQTDLRVARPIDFKERYTVMPFIEFFNLFNRSNPGNNYVGDVSALTIPGTNAPLVPSNELENITSLCVNVTCTQTKPITSLNQLRQPAGALGDFFGPGTTVGIPFAAQLGVRFTF